MEEKKSFSINWVELGKLFLAALVIFTLKHFVVNFAGIEFRNNETTSMGGVLLGLVFVAMVLEYWKGFHIIGKGDGKGASIIAGIGAGIFASSIMNFFITVVVAAVVFGILDYFLSGKREKERLEREARKPKHDGKKKKSKKKKR